MGVVMWIAAGSLALVLARIVPSGRRGQVLEGVVALAGAVLFGLVATALDFGGWREADWRAALFAFFGALALVGTMRAIALVVRPATPRH